MGYKMPDGGTRFALGGAYRATHGPATVPKSKRLFPVSRKEPFRANFVEFLVRAARKQRYQHHQVRQRKQPLVRLFAGRFRSPRDEAQVPALRKIADMIDANATQVGNFRVGKNLLARFYGNHGLVPHTVCPTASTSCSYIRLMLFVA